MIMLEQTGVGQVSNDTPLYDPAGSGLLPVQAEVSGTATFRVLGRVSPDAPWVEVREDATEDWIESFGIVPYLALEISSGDGSVKLWIGTV